MNPAKKQNWKCSICVNANKKITVNPAEQNNIITRKKSKNLQQNHNATEKSPGFEIITTPLSVTPHEISNSYKLTTSTSNIIASPTSTPINIHQMSKTSSPIESDLSEDSFKITERLSRSFEHTLPNDKSIENELQEKIRSLQTELSTTQTELENTIIENNELKRSIAKMTKDIQTLKNLCKSPKIDYPHTSKKRQLLSQNFFTPPRSSATKEANMEYSSFLRKISDLEQALQKSNNEIECLKNLIQKLQNGTIEENINQQQSLSAVACSSQKGQHKIIDGGTCKKSRQPYQCDRHMKQCSVNKSCIISCENKPQIHIFGDEQVVPKTALLITASQIQVLKLPSSQLGHASYYCLLTVSTLL
ncbi:unnamed protein product [Diatraea saccharalis]|uniref:Uncharacterized protein n=1 Tax=Diatraea saccharalis TaxID=40085 RepID=A0A9N9QYU4_9NEOP|nr:unnamed protein product [Diatraea saccharalis]